MAASAGAVVAGSPEAIAVRKQSALEHFWYHGMAANCWHCYD